MTQCYFCSQNVQDLDYKDTEILRKYISGQFKILPRRKTGVCAKHQRKLAMAIKRARFMAFLPFTNK
jgi:small subunit ribosomal protein S18